MKKSFFTLTLSLFLAGVGFAQEAPKPDAKGNYLRPEGPVQSQGLSFGGALWRINVAKLNVRKEPSLKGKVITVFKKGEQVAAFYNRYGGEGDGSNLKDAQGRTWLKVYLDPKKFGEGKSGYIRANSRYIRPVLPKGVADTAPVLAAEPGDEDAGGVAAGNVNNGGVAAGKVQKAGNNGAPKAGNQAGNNGGGNINININIGGSNGNQGNPGKANPNAAGPKDPAPQGPPPVANAQPGAAAPVVGGIGVKFAPGWNNWTKNGTMYSTSPDQGSRIAIIKVTGLGQDGPWDDVQAKMAKHLGPHFPGLSALTEVNTEHDVFRDGVGLRVVTYTANFGGKAVDLVVDFAREDNKDGKGLVLIARATPKGNAAAAQTARSVAESLKLKK